MANAGRLLALRRQEKSLAQHRFRFVRVSASVIARKFKVRMPRCGTLLYLARANSRKPISGCIKFSEKDRSRSRLEGRETASLNACGFARIPFNIGKPISWSG